MSYFSGESGAFVDKGGIYLNSVGATGEGLSDGFGVGDASTGVYCHGFANFFSYVGYYAEGVGQEGFAAETAATHHYGGFFHRTGVGGGNAVDAEFAGDADEGQDVFLLLGVVVGRDFEEEGRCSETVDSFEEISKGTWLVEHTQAAGIGGTDVDLDALCQWGSPSVALGEFVDGETGDAENEGIGRMLSKIGFDGVDATAGEAEGVDEGLLPGSAEQSGTGVPGAWVKGYGAADYVAEAEVLEGIEVGAVFVAASGYAQGIGDGDAGKGCVESGVVGFVKGGQELPEKLSS